MATKESRYWITLERWSSALFLLAGGFFVIFAGFWGAYAFTPMESELVQDAFGPAGWTASFLGLLGLYRSIRDQARRISKIAALFAGLGVVGAAITAVVNVGGLLGAVQNVPAWVDAFQLLILVGIVPGFLTFAYATIRTGGISRRVEFLLIAPAGIFIINFIRVATLGSTTPIWAPFLLGAGQALALLGIGYLLRTDVGKPHAKPAHRTAVE